MQDCSACRVLSMHTHHGCTAVTSPHLELSNCIWPALLRIRSAHVLCCVPMQRVVAAPGAAAGTYALYMIPDCTDPTIESRLVATQLIYKIRHKYATLRLQLAVHAAHVSPNLFARAHDHIHAAGVMRMLGHKHPAPHIVQLPIGTMHMQCVSSCAWCYRQRCPAAACCAVQNPAVGGGGPVRRGPLLRFCGGGGASRRPGGAGAGRSPGERQRPLRNIRTARPAAGASQMHCSK